MESKPKIRFFFGSNTAVGFRSYFEQLLGPNSGYRLFILKGGPGTGKSSLMKKMGAAFEKAGDQVIYIPCASDPDSLDAVMSVTRRLALVDGTAPHTLDPTCPGAVETMLDPGDGFDLALMEKNREEILSLNQAISYRHSRATGFIAAADALLFQNEKAAAPYVDEAAIDDFVYGYFHGLEREGRGRESKRLLSAVSVDAIIYFQETLSCFCKKRYCIPDPYGAASGLFLEKLKNAALSRGVDALSCPCSIAKNPRLDHVIFRGLGVGFSKTCDLLNPGQEGVLLPDFMKPLPKEADREKMAELNCRAGELLFAAAKEVGEAKRLHDELEALYVKAMDFSVMEGFYHRILGEAGLN